MDRLSASVLESFIHLTGADQVLGSSPFSQNGVNPKSPPPPQCLTVAPPEQPAVLPQWHRPADAGGVELVSHQPPVRRGEPLPHLGVCTRHSGPGPLGHQLLQLPAAGEPPQALPHRPQLRLDVRLHAAAAAVAAGRHQVRPACCCCLLQLVVLLLPLLVLSLLLPLLVHLPFLPLIVLVLPLLLLQLVLFLVPLLFFFLFLFFFLSFILLLFFLLLFFFFLCLFFLLLLLFFFFLFLFLFCSSSSSSSSCYSPPPSTSPPLLSSSSSSPINAKKLNSLTSSDSYIGLWRNYLILCCSSASSSPSMSSSSSTSGSVRCSPPETLASTPDSGYSYDSKVSSMTS